jgi:hypothetical protein
MAAAEHVLRYLRGMYEKGILFGRGVKHANLLWGWVDADWAGDTDTRRSHTGFVLAFNGGPISWKSRRQDSVALSTSETEYMVASEGGKEVVYMRDILQELVLLKQNLLTSLKIISRLWLCLLIQSAESTPDTFADTMSVNSPLLVSSSLSLLVHTTW